MLLGISRITCLDTHPKATNNRGGVAKLERRKPVGITLHRFYLFFFSNSAWSVGEKIEESPAHPVI
jgi:hypothetical protein